MVEGIRGNSKGMDLVKILHATIKFQIIKNCKRKKHDLDFFLNTYWCDLNVLEESTHPVPQGKEQQQQNKQSKKPK